MLARTSLKHLMVCLVGTLLLTTASAQDDLSLETLLTGGTTSAITTLSDALTADPSNAELRFSLGMAHFLGAVEYLAQSWYQYGLAVDNLGMAADVPFLRLPLPENPDPDEFTNEDFRRVLQGMVDRLEAADSTLANIDENVKLVVNFDQLRLDLNNDGTAGAEERLWTIYTTLNRMAAGMGEEPPPLGIAFDNGDVHWLRGYSNLLAALLETWLAVDNQAIFDNGAHLFFPNADTPFDILNNQAILQDDFIPIDTTIVDTVALVYLTLRLEVNEPERLEKAIMHLENVTAQSRLSWASILAEADNDREWIPNSEQQSVVPVNLTPEMIDGWQTFLDEFEGILAGEILLPFWRVQTPGVGINFRRAFLETRTFDVILWLQGSAATPYLEEGEVTQEETWQRLNALFGGNFVGFAFWIN
jgi:hypothetical protein